MSPSISRRRQANTTRKSIFRSAVQLLRKRGYDGTSIRDICKRAGVSVGTFYLYYSSKDDILSELLRRQWKAEEKAAKPLVLDADHSVYPHVEDLMCIWAQSFSSFAANDGAPQLFPPSFVHKNIISNESPFFRRLKETVSFGQENGTLLTEIDAEEVCWKLIRFGRGIVQDWILREQEYDLIPFMKSELRFFYRLFSGKPN